MNFYVKKLQGRRNSLEGTKRRNSMFERLSSLVKFLQENFIHTRLSRNTRTKEKNFSKEKILHRGTRFFRSRSKCRESFRKRQWPLKRIFLTSSSSNEWKNRGCKARWQSSCCIVDRSTDPFYVGACSRRWNVEIGKRFLHFLSAWRRDVAPGRNKLISR